MRPSDQDTGDTVAGSGGLLKLIVLLAVGGGLFMTLHGSSGAALHLDSLEGMKQQLEARGLAHGAGFLAGSAILIFAGVPRLLFFAVAGLLMGFAEGLLLALSASMLGSFASFLFLRWSGRDWIRQRFGHHRLIGRIISIEPEIAAVFMARQLPVSNLIINAGLALSRIDNTTFILGSFLGFLPQGAAAALIGSGAFKSNPSEGSVQLIGAAALVLGIFVWVLIQRIKKERMITPGKQQ